MNSTQARSRLLHLAQELTEEGQRHPRGRRRAQLAHASIQLAYLARSVDTQPGPVIEAVFEASMDLMVGSASSRAFGAGNG